MGGRRTAASAPEQHQTKHTSSDLQRRRTVVASARFSASEAAQLRALAGKRSLSTCLRELVLQHLAPPPTTSSASPTNEASAAPIWWTCNLPAATGPDNTRLVWLNAPRGIEGGNS